MIGGGYITGITLGSNFAGGVGVDALVSASAFMDSNRNGLALLKYVHSGTLLSFQAPGDRTFGPAVDISGGDGDFTLVSDNPSKWVKLTLDVSDFSANGETTIAFTSSTNEFDGLATLMSSSQIRTSTGANGDVASFAILDELSDSVKARDNLAYIMPAALRNKYNSPPQRRRRRPDRHHGRQVQSAELQRDPDLEERLDREHGGQGQRDDAL